MKAKGLPLFQKVDCFLIPVQDLDAGLQFYGDKLEHQLIWRTEEAAGLRLANTDTELVLHTKLKEVEADLLVDSVDVAANHFISAGGKVLKGPFDIQVGRCAVLQDPFGNVLVAMDMTKGPLVTDDKGTVIGKLK